MKGTPMQAAPADQAALLTIVELDAKAKALEARKRHLPEHEQLNELNAKRHGLADAATKASTKAADDEVAMRRVEEDLQTATTRLARDRKRIDDGVVNDARSIASLEAEIAHLHTRISELEDKQLEFMVAIEDAKKQAEAAKASRGDVENQMRGLIASRDEATKAADAELAELASQRATVVGGLPDALVAVYEKAASRGGGGASQLKAGRCTGCGLMLDALARRAAEEAPADELVRCAECGRIFVRN